MKFYSVHRLIWLWVLDRDLPLKIALEKMSMTFEAYLTKISKFISHKNDPLNLRKVSEMLRDNPLKLSEFAPP